MATGRVRVKSEWFAASTFQNACTAAGVNTYVGNGLDIMLDDIANLPSGVSNGQLQNSGPAIYYILGKLNTSYFGGFVFGYYGETSHVAFKYNSGTCSVKALQ